MPADWIDFSAVQPRAFTFTWTELRDPFAPASFELVNNIDTANWYGLVLPNGTQRLLA